jgi:hypothetical protein
MRRLDREMMVSREVRRWFDGASKTENLAPVTVTGDLTFGSGQGSLNLRLPPLGSAVSLRPINICHVGIESPLDVTIIKRFKF